MSNPEEIEEIVEVSSEESVAETVPITYSRRNKGPGKLAAQHKHFHFTELPSPIHAGRPMLNDFPPSKRELGDYIVERQARHIDMIENELDETRQRVRHAVKNATEYYASLEDIYKMMIGTRTTPPPPADVLIQRIRRLIRTRIGQFAPYEHENTSPHPFGPPRPGSPEMQDGETRPGQPYWKPLFSPGNQCVSPAHSPGVEVLAEAARGKEPKHAAVRAAANDLPHGPFAAGIGQPANFWTQGVHAEVEWPTQTPVLPAIAAPTLRIWQRRARGMGAEVEEMLENPLRLPGIAEVFRDDNLPFDAFANRYVAPPAPVHGRSGDADQPLDAENPFFVGTQRSESTQSPPALAQAPAPAQPPPTAPVAPQGRKRKAELPPREHYARAAKRACRYT